MILAEVLEVLDVDEVEVLDENGNMLASCSRYREVCTYLDNKVSRITTDCNNNEKIIINVVC